MNSARWAVPIVGLLLGSVGAFASATPHEQAIRAVLDNAEVHGLRAADYSDPDLRVALGRFIADLRDGRSNPWIYRSQETAPQPADGKEPTEQPRDAAQQLTDVVEQVLASDDPVEALRLLEPPYPDYRRTMHALELYRAIAEHDDAEPLPELDNKKKTVEPGEAWAGVPRLARLLASTGDLDPNAAVPVNYDGVLVDALKRFQTRHGIEPDGRIGKGTLAALNTPFAARIAQLELTLERWRWLPREFDGSMILVNVPEYKLRVLDKSHRLELELNVVAGSARTPTPELRASLTHLIFRPYWNVPWSIQSKEIIPDIEKDRGYLRKHAYEVVTPGGQVVSTGDVSDETLAGLRSGKLQIRQVPGGKNALGMVKLMFPNTENVYLHDTPSKSYFGRATRSLSHGCVRVQDVTELAAWALRNQPEWTRERIAAAMSGSGANNVRVNLDTAVPVLLVYQTTAVGDDGTVYFFQDIYNRDKALSKAAASLLSE